MYGHVTALHRRCSIIHTLVISIVSIGFIGFISSIVCIVFIVSIVSIGSIGFIVPHAAHAQNTPAAPAPKPARARIPTDPNARETMEEVKARLQPGTTKAALFDLLKVRLTAIGVPCVLTVWCLTLCCVGQPYECLSTHTIALPCRDAHTHTTYTHIAKQRKTHPPTMFLINRTLAARAWTSPP